MLFADDWTFRHSSQPLTVVHDFSGYEGTNSELGGNGEERS